MARFDYIVQHVPGKLLYTADTLSRAPVDTEETTEFPAEVEDSVIQSLLATSQGLEIYRRAQAENSVQKSLNTVRRVGRRNVL